MRPAIKNALTAFFSKEKQRMVGFVDSFLTRTEDYSGEDIVQEVFLTFFTRQNDTLELENLPAYVYRSLRNRITDKKRRDARVQYTSLDGEDDLLNQLSDSKHPEDDYEEKEAVETLFTALAELSPLEEEIVIRTEFEGTTFKELAEEKDIPLGTLLSKKKRALEKIKKNLPDGGNLI